MGNENQTRSWTVLKCQKVFDLPLVPMETAHKLWPALEIQCTGNASTLHHTSSPLLPAAWTGKISRIIILGHDFSFQCLVPMHGTLLGVQPLPIQLSQAADEKFACKTHQPCSTIPPSSKPGKKYLQMAQLQTAECACFFLPVLEHSAYILNLLLSLSLRKTNQPFIVKRGWQHRLLVQAYHLLPGEIRHRFEPWTRTQLFDTCSDTHSPCPRCVHVHTASISQSPSLSLVFCRC